MTVNSVITNGKEIFRILQIDNDQYFVMDCYKYNKPKECPGRLIRWPFKPDSTC